MTSDEEVVAYKKGAWSEAEDEKLRRAVHEYGSKNWVAIEKYSGLARPAKNCRLRWLNYLRPNLKKHPLTPEEEELILYLHSKYGNSWSKIASELPGRSDNDIKNFWHKRTKKCKKYQLPIYSGEQQTPTNHINIYRPNYDTNDESGNISTSLPSPENQFSRTMSFPNTPTSQASNSLLSPQQTPQSCPVNTHQDHSGFNMFASFRKPPILSGSFKRFSRDSDQLLQPENAAESLNKVTCSGPSMESPRLPFRLKLSPGVQSVHVLDPQASYMHVSSGSQLMSPNSAAQLSLIPLGSCSGPSLVMYGDSTVQLDQTEPMSIDRDQAVTVKTELPLTQSEAMMMLETKEFTHGAECDNSLELMNELKEAQARVKFLKKKLRLQRRIPNNRTLPRRTSLQELSMNGKRPEESSLTDAALLDQNFSQSTRKECVSDTDAKSVKVNDGHTCISKRKENVIGISKKGLRRVKSVDNGKRFCKLGRRVSSEEEDLVKLCEKRPSSDLFDSLTSEETGNASNSRSSEDVLCSITQGLYGESSNLMAELLNQRSDIEQLFASQEQERPIDMFSPIYSQSKGEYGLVGNSFQREFSDPCFLSTMQDMTNYRSQVGEDFSFQNPVDGIPESSSVYELMSLLNQYTAWDLLDPDDLAHAPALENNSPGQCNPSTCNGELNISNLKIECTASSSHALEKEPYPEKNVIKGENLWQEEHMSSPDRVDPVLDSSTIQSMGSKHAANELGGSYDAGVMRPDLDHTDQDTMPEELLSQLKFFHTSSQTQEWYNYGDTNSSIDDTDGFGMDVGVSVLCTSPPAITISDYI